MHGLRRPLQNNNVKWALSFLENVVVVRREFFFGEFGVK